MIASTAEAVGSFANSSIADHAELRAEGQYGGQCKQFVNDIVTEASGGTVSVAGGYQQAFANAGAIEVTSANAIRGDIIQVTPAGSTDSTAESLFDLYSSSHQLHTAIILANNGGGNFSVIDSNSYGYPEQVHRHSYNPYASASGSIIKIWRLGTTVTSGNPAPFAGVGSATYLGSDRLVNGQQMHSGQYITSSNGQYVLIMQGDGNLVSYSGTKGAIWSSGTDNNPGAWLGVQSDGNIVIYSSSGVALWSTGTSDATRLVMQPDGNLVAYNSSGQARYNSGTIYPIENSTPYGSATLSSGKTLKSGEYLRSGDGRYFLTMQSDGNLVLYGPGYHVLWNAKTAGKGGTRLVVQGDGNIVMYKPGGTAVWALSWLGGSGAVRLVVQSDGNVVAYKTNGQATWHTHTNGLI